MEDINALIILAKYPRPGQVKTRLIPMIGDIATNRISELFLIDLLRRFASIHDINVIIAGASQDTDDEFKGLLAKYQIPLENTEIFLDLWKWIL